MVDAELSSLAADEEEATEEEMGVDVTVLVAEAVVGVVEATVGSLWISFTESVLRLPNLCWGRTMKEQIVAGLYALSPKRLAERDLRRLPARQRRGHVVWRGLQGIG